MTNEWILTERKIIIFNQSIMVKVKVKLIKFYYFGINSGEIYFQVRDLWSIWELRNGLISVEKMI